jgi:hypothetical protein
MHKEKSPIHPSTSHIYEMYPTLYYSKVKVLSFVTKGKSPYPIVWVLFYMKKERLLGSHESSFPFPSISFFKFQFFLPFQK